MAGKKKPHRFKLNVKLIHSFLDESNHSQAWLADQLGVHFNTIQNYLTEKSMPNMDNLYKLSMLMNLEPDRLLLYVRPWEEK